MGQRGHLAGRANGIWRRHRQLNHGCYETGERAQRRHPTQFQRWSGEMAERQENLTVYKVMRAVSERSDQPVGQTDSRDTRRSISTTIGRATAA
jgi:hypothetical protein